MSLFPIVVKGQYGFIREDGSIAVEPRYDSAMSFCEGFAGIQKDGKWGFIDDTGEIAIQPQFDSCQSFSFGLALVESGDLKQYLDRSGRVVICTNFYRCDSFEGDLAPVMPDISSSGAFINRTGAIVLSGRRFLFSHLALGLINCPDGDKWGYINSDGAFVIPPRFYYAHPFSDGLAAVALRREQAYAFIDTDGQIVIDGEFNGADIRFSGNLCAVWADHFGFIDRSGTLVIPYCFDFADHFSEKLAVAKMPESELYGYIDESGLFQVPQSFTCADAFENGLASVIVGKDFGSYHYGYIDRSGRYVWKPTR